MQRGRGGGVACRRLIVLTGFCLLRQTSFGSSQSLALFPTETSVLDRHAEERVFVPTVIGGKTSWWSKTSSWRPRTFSRTREAPFDGGDQAGLSLHAFVVGHGAKRISDSESVSV